MQELLPGAEDVERQKTILPNVGLSTLFRDLRVTSAAIISIECVRGRAIAVKHALLTLCLGGSSVAEVARGTS